MTHGGAPLRILVVSDLFPFPPTSGSAMRIHQLCRYLAREHRVTLVTLARPGQLQSVDELEALGLEVIAVSWHQMKGVRRRRAQVRALLAGRPFRSAERLTPELRSAVRECLAREAFDIVQVEGSAMMAADLFLGVPVVLDEHNVESEVLRRQQLAERTVLRRRYQRLQTNKQERFEASVWRAPAAIAVTSEREVPAV
ncbi:MAG TPA: glycosyltransferase, partial [Frankiaceae bacterium]|nr:glycosyltransferase [Frankiaceae bacterium]